MALWVRFRRDGGEGFGTLEGETIRVHGGDLFAGAAPTGEELPSSKPELNDGPAHVHFDHAYIGDFAKMGKILGGASMLHPRSASHPALATFGERADCFAVLMPMRRAVDRSAVLTRNVVMAG